MIEFEYMNYIVELMFGEEMTKELFCRRFAALSELRGIIAGYEKEGFRKDLLETIFCKKADFIMEAESEEDMKEILKLLKKLPRHIFSDTPLSGAVPPLWDW